MSSVTIDGVVFDDYKLGVPRNPGALEIVWGYDHRIKTYPIPGFSDKSQATSNKVLLTCDITIRTTDAVTTSKKGLVYDGYHKFKELQNIIKSPGPHMVEVDDWGPKPMYLKNPRFRQVAGEDNWVGTWTLPFVEARD
jgi:hypothetical protein